MIRVLVCGANGQLGSEFQQIQSSWNESVHFVFYPKQLLDINDYNRLIHIVEKENIDCVINCAAYTKVDEAERNETMAHQINALGAGNVARVCASLNINLVHISTDYVFDGTQGQPYKESDIVNPQTVYGKTKLIGEQMVHKNLQSSIIIRTSWMYSFFGNNFVKTMYHLGLNQQSINVVNDQFGSPTYAKNLAEVIIKIIVSKNPHWGQIYHYCNDGIISWYDFAKAIMEIAELNSEVLPISSNEYPQLAKRPSYSSLDNSKIKVHYKLPSQLWKDSLKDCIQKIRSEGL